MTMKRKRVQAGIGDTTDLKMIKPKDEEIIEKFKAQYRYTGKEEHKIPHYPALPFEYSIGYKGETLEQQNEQDYSLDVYAHPEKVFNYKIKETKILPVDRLWETEAIFEADVKKNNLLYAIGYEGQYPGMRQNTVEWKLKIEGKFFNNDLLDFYYAVKWKGYVVKKSYGDMKKFFRAGSSEAFLVGKVKDKNWKYEKSSSGTYSVVDRTNTAAVSAISSRKFAKWTDYEATFTFKPLLARDEASKKAMKRVGSNFKTVPGFDDDTIGIMFKVKDKNNFYILLVEGSERAYYANGTRPPNNLEGYNINTNLPKVGLWGDFTNRSVKEGAQANFSNWASYEKTKGWGSFHRRVYRCVNGKFYRVDKTPGTKSNTGKYASTSCKDLYKNGRGWAMNKKHKVKVVTEGYKVTIYMSWDGGEFHKLYSFNTAYKTGSVGVFNVSQAVAFSTIEIVERVGLEGRMPINKNEYLKNPDASGKRSVNLGRARSFLDDSIKKELSSNGLGGKSITITSMSKDIKKGSETKGRLTLPSSVNGDIKVKSLSNTLNKAVTVTLAPDDGWWTSKQDQIDFGTIDEYLEELDEYRDWINGTNLDPDDFVLEKVTPIVKDKNNGKAWIDKEDDHFHVSASKTEVWRKVSGRIPNDEKEFFEWDGSGDFIHAKVASEYIANDIKENLGLNADDDEIDGDTEYDIDDIQFTRLKGIVDDAMIGEVIINAGTAPIVARNYNALDAGQHLKGRYIHCGSVHITPDNNYDNCVVAFEDIRALFDEEHELFFGRKDLENIEKTYNLVFPVQQDKIIPPDGINSTEGGCFLEANVDEDENVIQCYEDFFFDGSMLCMWSCEFPIVETEIEFNDKVHAYEGLLFFDPLSYFNPNSWTTYQLKLNPKGLNEELDDIYWANGDSFEKSRPGTKLAIQTKEYYKAVFKNNAIKNKGTVSSDEVLYIKLPSYPENYFDEQREEPMPNHFESCDFLLDAFNNGPYVISNWLSDYTASNDVITVDENRPTLNGQIARSKTNENVPATPSAYLGRKGMPIIKIRVADETFSVRHFIEVTCRTRPLATEWNSGKYIGYGVLNGKRPFFNERRGKNDITGVSVDVIDFPDNIIPETLKGPYIEVLDVNSPHDSRVSYKYDPQTKTVSFSSDYMEDYKWETKWQSDWIEAAEEFEIGSKEVKEIYSITNHFLGADFNYDEATRTIYVEDIEIETNHNFVHAWKNNLSLEQLEKINKNEATTIAIFAQMLSVMPKPWSPLIHNGYYYQEGIEHYLFANKKTIESNDVKTIELDKRPEQGSPVIVRNAFDEVLVKTNFYEDGDKYTHTCEETFNGNGQYEYYLKQPNIDISKMNILLNGELVTDEMYIFHKEKNSIEFFFEITTKDSIRVLYEVKDSYYIKMNSDVENYQVLSDKAEIHLQDSVKTNGIKIDYESAVMTPYYREEGIKLNPILNNYHNGFVYIDNEDIQKPKFIEMVSSQYYVERFQKDRVLITVKVFDELNNPIQNEVVAIYRDNEMIGTKVTNTAGEAYITDVPKDNVGLVTTYKSVCRELSTYIEVNQTRENERKRYSIEITPERYIVKSGEKESMNIKFRLRNHEWIVMKDGYDLQVSIYDTEGNVTNRNIIINESGYGELKLSTEKMPKGEIFILAKYDMKFEYAINSVYIQVIGE